MPRKTETPTAIRIDFVTPKEREALIKIQALTLARSPKTAILRMIETYDALVHECAELKILKNR